MCSRARTRARESTCMYVCINELNEVSYRSISEGYIQAYGYLTVVFPEETVSLFDSQAPAFSLVVEYILFLTVTDRITQIPTKSLSLHFINSFLRHTALTPWDSENNWEKLNRWCEIWKIGLRTMCLFLKICFIELCICGRHIFGCRRLRRLEEGIRSLRCEVVMSCLTGVLQTELGSSATAVTTEPSPASYLSVSKFWRDSMWIPSMHVHLKCERDKHITGKHF